MVRSESNSHLIRKSGTGRRRATLIKQTAKTCCNDFYSRWLVSYRRGKQKFCLLTRFTTYKKWHPRKRLDNSMRSNDCTAGVYQHFSCLRSTNSLNSRCSKLRRSLVSRTTEQLVFHPQVRILISSPRYGGLLVCQLRRPTISIGMYPTGTQITTLAGFSRVYGSGNVELSWFITIQGLENWCAALMWQKGWH